MTDDTQGGTSVQGHQHCAENLPVTSASLGKVGPSGARSS